MPSLKFARTARFAVTSAAGAASYDGAGGGSLGAAPSGFAAGTLIQVPAGLLEVERLRVGDKALDEGGTAHEILAVIPHRITGETIRRDVTRAAISIHAGAFGRDLPRRDLIVGPGQRVRGAARGDALRMLPASSLVNGRSVQRMTGDIDLLQLVLAPGHIGGVRAEGLCCASRPIGRAPPVSAELVVHERLRLDIQDGMAAPALQGMVETADRHAVVGWALDGAHPGAQLGVEIVEGRQVLAQFPADMARPDLAMAGLGEGRCAFAVALRPALSARADHILQIRGAGGGQDMPGTPMLLPRSTLTADDLARALDHPSEQPDALALVEQIERLLQARATRA